MVKVTKKNNKASTTDKSLLVQTYSEYESQMDWDKTKIVDALKLEARVPDLLANEVANSVEKRIIKMELEKVSSTFIRALVDEELAQRNEKKRLTKQQLLSIPTYDLESIIFSRSLENANIQANGPEAINMNIAGTILKQYALNKIFSSDVSEAHLTGVIHIHDLSDPTRVYCSAHSIELIAKYGLIELESLSSKSSPASNIHTLIGHINTFLCAISQDFAGALGLANANTFMAPFLTNLSYKEIKSAAQYFIFSLSQTAFARGGQSLFIDCNVDLKCPSYLKNVPAIVKKGQYATRFDLIINDEPIRNAHIIYHPERKKATKKDLINHLKEYGKDDLIDQVDMETIEIKSKLLTFGDFEKQIQDFAQALMEVWYAGDKNGQPFFFPKFQCHIDEEIWTNKRAVKLYEMACKLAADKNITSFVFDRDEISLSQCCRLRETVTDMSMIENPESLRFCGFQNVSINIPQCTYRAQGDFDKTIKEIKKSMDIAIKAHLEKKKFIEKLMDSPEKPLWQIGKVWSDGFKYVDLEKATYIIGVVGVNDAIHRITGQQMHESDDSYKLGLKLVTHMYLYSKKLAQDNGLKIVLEETPGESANPRLAKIDLARFEESKNYIKGNQKTGDVYYTNSCHFSPDADIPLTERIEKQSRFAQIVPAGSITHVFLKEQDVSTESVMNLVEKTLKNTFCSQLTISGEMVVCEECGHIHKGFDF